MYTMLHYHTKILSAAFDLAPHFALVSVSILLLWRKYNAESPKQGSKRFNSIVKTINIADLGIIYLCVVRTALITLNKSDCS